MTILYDAALAWNQLLNTTYTITYGKKGTLHNLILSFEKDQFYHLCGIHYLSDIDLKIGFSKRKFHDLVLNHRIDESTIQCSRFWPDIIGRLIALKKLARILDSDFNLYIYNKKVVPFYSSLDAKYLIENPDTNDIVFLFLDGKTDNLYCRSVFTKTDHDYTANQKKISVLRKVKTVQGIRTVVLDKL